MTAKVIKFPSPGLINAVRHLETHRGPVEADALACTIVLMAIRRGDPAPPWSVTLLLSTLHRYGDHDLARGLAMDLSSLDHPEVLAVGLDLVRRTTAPQVHLGELLLARHLRGHGFPFGR